MLSAERFDLMQQVVHSDLMRRICPSRQENGDGFIRKLWAGYPAWDNEGVSESPDLAKIVDVLKRATVGGDAKWSQRGLSSLAKEGRDCVGDIVNGRNKNPTIKVLTALADAMGEDLSVFGVTPERVDPPTEDELRQALLDMLPGMPRGAPDKRAQYLAEGVARVLRLPPSRRTMSDQPNEREVDAPPRGATN